MKIIKILSVLFLVIFLNACSKPLLNVIRVDNIKPPSKISGFYYALPRTFVRVDVVVDKTEQIRGPYAEYAEKYLGQTNVIKSNSTSYEISEYKLSTFVEPDPQQFYFVEMNKVCGKNLDEFKLALDETGMLISTGSVNDSFKSANSVYVIEEEVNVFPEIFKFYTDLDPFEKVDTIIEKVNIDSGTVEKMTFKRSMVKKTPEQKAKEAADFFTKVKENRFSLISGFQEVNYDKETFKYMNEELEKMENEYRKLFTGITFTKKITYSFVYLPSSARAADSVPLFRFSMLRGVLNTSDIYGETVYLSINKYGNSDILQTYQTRKDSLKISRHGFYYRMPDYAEVKLYDNKTSKFKGKFLISQYGVLTYMPAGIRRFDVYPETGGVRNIRGK